MGRHDLPRLARQETDCPTLSLWVSLFFATQGCESILGTATQGCESTLGTVTLTQGEGCCECRGRTVLACVAWWQALFWGRNLLLAGHTSRAVFCICVLAVCVLKPNFVPQN